MQPGHERHHAVPMNHPNSLFPPGALTGLKVIDASRVLGGPLCGQILGDHGADVLKIESPDGDDTRKWGPPFKDGMSAYFSGLNRNKSVQVLDLSSQAGRDLLLALLEDADVLIENFKPSTLAGWGISAEGLQERFPRLIHCRVSGFGSDGPLGGLPAYDTAVQGMTGLMSVNGDTGTGPLRVGLPVVDMTTALNATIGVLLALNERNRSGKGQLVETTLYDNGLSLLHPHAPNYLMTGKAPVPTGNAHPSIYPYDAFETKNVSVYLAVGNDAQFRKLCSMLGQPELGTDLRFCTAPLRSENRRHLRPILADLLVGQDGWKFAEELLAAGVPASAIAGVDQALEHPHTKHRGMVVSIGESYRGIGSPVTLSRTPASYRTAPPIHPQEKPA